MPWAGEDYEHSAAQGAGYRNGYRTGRLKTAEGPIGYAAPQVASRDEPFRSALREGLQGRTAALEASALELFARGLSTRDIADVLADGDGRPLVSRATVSQLSERLWAEYQAFASRYLAEHEIVYLFVDGIAERLRPGQPRKTVPAAWGVARDGRKVLLHLMAGSREDVETMRVFFQGTRSRGLDDPLLVVTDGAPGVIRAAEECFPRAVGQRCLVHWMRNFVVKVPERAWPEFKERVRPATKLPRGQSPASCVTGWLPIMSGAAERRGLLPGRLRGLHRASALPDYLPPGAPDHESAGGLFLEERRRLKIIPTRSARRRP